MAYSRSATGCCSCTPRTSASSPSVCPRADPLPANTILRVDILVNVDVDDRERAIAFYTSAFELRVGRRMGDDFVELLGASSALYLLVKAAGTEPCAGAVRTYARHWTPVHMDFVVE